MADPYIKEFHGRLRRIAKIHRKGGGFEASGTLGQSFYTRQNRKRSPVLRPVLMILAAVVLFKAVVLAHKGPADYLATIDTLRSGSVVEQIGATILSADPLTVMISGWMAPLFG